MKKIYFACAITAGRDYAHTYQDIVDMIKAEGLEVTSEIFAGKDVTTTAGVRSQQHMNASEIWKSDLDWIQESDGIVAEVSLPSLGIGYEIATAYHWNKPVLALWHKRPEHRLSSMISGSPNVTVFEYTNLPEVEPAIKKFLAAV